MNDQVIYKIATREQWEEAEASGTFQGAPVDFEDGFIHLSTARQTVETAERHFAGQNDLVLVAVDGAGLGDRLVYEVSRGGALFPHLYAPLDLKHVLWVKPLPIDDKGTHIFPDAFI
jgi:uncharacterized protein (DUF952 family)